MILWIKVKALEMCVQLKKNGYVIFDNRLKIVARCHLEFIDNKMAPHFFFFFEKMFKKFNLDDDISRHYQLNICNKITLS